ncbi:MAG: sulfite exporter TauE/SafE family protein [Candidatus Bathyarchaeia archaeon]|jgi:uncharacterized membrane protein YfcA
MWEILLPFLGFLIGTVAALTGIGGGVFIVPLLTLFYAFSPANAAGTSLTVIVFTALASTLNYSKQRRISYRTGALLAVATAPGGILGVYLTTVISAKLLGAFFGFFVIIFVALPMSIDPNSIRLKHSSTSGAGKPATKSDSASFSSLRKMLLCAILSFLGGIASGLLGIGGGVLIVPILTLVVGMPIHFATATSMFTMTFTSTSEAIQHYFAKQTNFEYALLLALGTVLGAQVGAYLSKKTSGKNLRRIFGLVIVIVGVQMILKYI